MTFLERLALAWAVVSRRGDVVCHLDAVRAIKLEAWLEAEAERNRAHTVMPIEAARGYWFLERRATVWVPQVERTRGRDGREHVYLAPLAMPFVGRHITVVRW